MLPEAEALSMATTLVQERQYAGCCKAQRDLDTGEMCSVDERINFWKLGYVGR
jgi:hypothetical protein